MIIADNDIIPPQAQPSFTKKDFESLYITLRKKEHRLYTDEQVAFLPEIDRSHIHYHEWQLRKRSAERLYHYLQKKKPLSILEVGCGNGWMIAKMATLKNVFATGTDINNTELEQARKVFGNRNNLFFSNDITADKKFDVIIFAASIQYFPSFEIIIERSFSLLNNNGEIHIIDSHFYNNAAIEKAVERSLAYYRSMGCEEMADHYFHHSIDSLNKFNHTKLFDPSSVTNKLLRKKDLFPWIRILK